ncbi:MAG TPA: hypothetical protein VEC19_07755 [Usitatibacter sp.]|nr:hypothetical protein [Usitatibacter sp.]
MLLALLLTRVAVLSTAESNANMREIISSAGVQMLVLITWYLRHTSEKAQRRRMEPIPEQEAPFLDRIDGR